MQETRKNVLLLSASQQSLGYWLICGRSRGGGGLRLGRRRGQQAERAEQQGRRGSQRGNATQQAGQRRYQGDAGVWTSAAWFSAYGTPRGTGRRA